MLMRSVAEGCYDCLWHSRALFDRLLACRAIGRQPASPRLQVANEHRQFCRSGRLRLYRQQNLLLRGVAVRTAQARVCCLPQVASASMHVCCLYTSWSQNRCSVAIGALVGCRVRQAINLRQVAAQRLIANTLCAILRPQCVPLPCDWLAFLRRQAPPAPLKTASGICRGTAGVIGRASRSVTVLEPTASCAGLTIPCHMPPFPQELTTVCTDDAKVGVFACCETSTGGVCYFGCAIMPEPAGHVYQLQKAVLTDDRSA